MANRITINGVDYTGEVEGIDNLVLSYSLDDSTKTVDVAISSTLVFRGRAFNYLKSIFFPLPLSGRDEQADIIIYSDCCNNSFPLKIQSDAVEICFVDCTITTSAFEETADIIAAKKLQELEIFVNKRINPKLEICINFGFWGSLISKLFLFVLTAVENIIAAVTLGNNQDLEDALAELRSYLAGCRGYVNAFYLRTILEEDLALVGLTLSSSILQSGDYANAVWIDPSETINTGGLLRPIQTIAENSLVGTITIAEFLEILSTVFNADYRIKNGVLTFERKDFFYNNNNQIVDVEGKYNDNRQGSKPCYTYTDEIKYAAARIAYSKDDIETAGNKAWFEKYRELVGYNEPFNPTYKGLKEIDIPIAPAVFTRDQFQESQLDKDRAPGKLVIDSKGLIERALPKIIVIQPQDVVNDAEFFEAKVVGNLADQNFNYPMYLRESEDITGDLYNNFFSICDTRNNPVFLYELEEFEYLADCAEKQDIINNRLDVHALTALGRGFPEEIDIAVNTGIVTLKNTKIKEI